MARYVIRNYRFLALALTGGMKEPWLSLLSNFLKSIWTLKMIRGLVWCCVPMMMGKVSAPACCSMPVTERRCVCRRASASSTPSSSRGITELSEHCFDTLRLKADCPIGFDDPEHEPEQYSLIGHTQALVKR